MKNRILFGTMLALLLVGSVSFADDDADKKRLLEEYDKITKEKAKEAEKEAERMAKENLQAAENNRSCSREWRSYCNRRRTNCASSKES